MITTLKKINTNKSGHGKQVLEMHGVSPGPSTGLGVFAN